MFGCHLTLNFKCNPNIWFGVCVQGRFEILSLSGSFTITEVGGVLNRSGGLSVSLAGPDGRVIGGGLAGLLIAATPIQVSLSISCSSNFFFFNLFLHVLIAHPLILLAAIILISRQNTCGGVFLCCQ